MSSNNTQPQITYKPNFRNLFIKVTKSFSWFATPVPEKPNELDLFCQDFSLPFERHTDEFYFRKMTFFVAGYLFIAKILFYYKIVYNITTSVQACLI